MGKNDLLTFYDGDDLTAKILGQYSGSRPRFKLYTSMADVTIQFQSDPATNIYGYNNGFVVHFFGNDLFNHFCCTFHSKVWWQEDFFKEINTFIQQECIKLIKTDSKFIYIVTKDFYFK